ncbi:glycosyltransferase [Sporosarcina sp. A2]|uniref:glycosyltransferase n=1 Tax=Sporosarcina sp. A2 TaxID=3393449 RepID=UPI003D7B3AC2
MRVHYKVSVIVPIYNVEAYLSKCIRSIQNQKLNDIQIILVDDGSTDKSLSICKEYAKEDKRIHLIEKSNGGVSSARNAGLEAAVGEYVGFVDPDDWIKADMYESMYNQVKKTGTEVCICNYVNEYKNNSEAISLNIHSDVLDGKDIKKLVADMVAPATINSNETAIMGSVWRTLISNRLIKTSEIKFNEEIHLMEDLLFIIETLLVCNKISIDNGYYYHYFHSSNSAMNLYRKNFYALNLKVYYLLTSILEKKPINSTLSHHMNIRYVNIGFNSIVNEIRIGNKKSIREKLTLIHDVSHDEKVKDILKSLNYDKLTLRKRLVLKSIIEGKVFFLFGYYSIIGGIIRIKNSMNKGDY